MLPVSREIFERKNKIGVRRETILSHFKEEDGFEDYKHMSDEELLDNFIGVGYIQNEESVNSIIYKGELPDDCIDVEAIGDVTGWPCSLELYYDLLNKVKNDARTYSF